MSRTVSVWLLCTTAICLLMPIPAQSGEDIDLMAIDPTPDLGMPIIVGQLTIDGNEDLLEKADLYNWPGGGTEDDPITISQFQFQFFKGSFCPIFNDTDLHIRISDCHFGNYNDEYWMYNNDIDSGGVLLQRSSNVTIDNCTSYHIRILAKSVNSRNLVISNNTLMYGYGGVLVDQCKSVNIENNLIKGFGIRVSNSYGSLIRTNTIVEREAHLSVTGSSNTIIENNTLIQSGIRFSITDSIETYINGNTWYGVGLEIKGNEETFETMEIGKDNIVSNMPVVAVRDDDRIEIDYPIGQLILINITDQIFIVHPEIDIANVSMITMGICDNVTISFGSFSTPLTSINIISSNGCRVDGGLFIAHEQAVRINRSSNITLENMILNEMVYAIVMEESTHCHILNNHFISGVYGMVITDSSFNTILGNQLDNTYGGIKIEGSSHNNDLIDNSLNRSSLTQYLEVEDLRTTSFINTTMDGKRILKIMDRDMIGDEIPGDIGKLILINVSDLKIRELTIEGIGNTVRLIDCSRIDISHCNLSSDGFPIIKLSSSIGVHVTNCTLFSGGIEIEDSIRISIDSCDFNRADIRIRDSNMISMSSCIFKNNHNSINIEGSHGIDITEFHIHDWDTAFTLFESNDIWISDSNINSEFCGINIDDSIGFNGYNISIRSEYYGIRIDESAGNSIDLCRIKCRYKTLIIEDSSGDRISNCTFESSMYPIFLRGWHYSEFDNNTIISGDDSGITVRNSVRCVISGCNILMNREDHYSNGLYLINVTDFNIEGNHISGFLSNGIYAYMILNSSISDNEITENGGGIYLRSGSGNLIVWNRFKNNSKYSMFIYPYDIVFERLFIATNNTIFGNYFIENRSVDDIIYPYWHGVADYGINNTWYSEEYGGNYWTWIGGPDRDGDGFVDNPIIINGTAGSMDRYPIAHVEPAEETDRGFPFISDIMIAFAILTFVLLILAGSHKIRFHFHKDPDLKMK